LSNLARDNARQLPSKGARFRGRSKVSPHFFSGRDCQGLVRGIDLPPAHQTRRRTGQQDRATSRVRRWHPAVFFHPSLYYDATALAYVLVFLVLKLCGVVGSAASMTDVFLANETIFTYTARGVSVLAAVLSMGVLFSMAKSLWGRQAGLTAALLAVFPLHVRTARSRSVSTASSY
jgi:hypothetical protein